MSRPHHYVHCDVPEGMTLAEYRGAKRREKPRKAGLVARLRRRRPSVEASEPQRRAA